MANPCFGTELKFSTSITLASLYGVVALPAILGNVVFLWVIYKARTIRTFSNLLLSSLATADLLVGLLIDPLWIARCVLPRRPYHNPFKIAIDSLWIQTSVTTTFSLCIVSLDRYIAVRSALLYNQIVTTRRCCMSVVFVWLASLAFGLSRIFVTNPANLPALWMCVTVVTILIPMVVIIFCYYRILDVAKKKYVIIAKHNVQRGVELVIEGVRNRKTATTVGLVVALFIISWLPSLVTSFIHLTTSDHCLKRQMRSVWLWVELIAFSSSGINPWLYSLRNDEFRKGMKRAFATKRISLRKKAAKRVDVK